MCLMSSLLFLDREQLQELIIHDSIRPSVISDHSSAVLTEFNHSVTDLRPITELSGCSDASDHRPPSVQPITELGGCSDASETDLLETERVDFQDITARFRQTVTWPCASSLTSDDNGCHSDHRSAETKNTNKTGRVVNGNNVTVGKAGYPRVSTAETEPLNTRPSVALSCLLQRVSCLAEQSALQVHLAEVHLAASSSICH